MSSILTNRSVRSRQPPTISDSDRRTAKLLVVAKSNRASGMGA